MSFLVRDRLHSSRTRFVGVAQPEDPELKAVHDALAGIDVALRREMPELFKKVDKIRSRPGRQVQRTEKPFVTTRRILECPRCGDNFPATKKSDIYCSTTCSGEQRRFLNSRSTMALDQLEQYREDAEAFRRGATLMAFFAAIAEQKGDHAGVEQIGHYKDVCLQMAALYDTLAHGDG